MYQFVKKNPTQIYKNLKPTNENLTEICKIIPVQVKIKSVIENWPLNIYIYKNWSSYRWEENTAFIQILMDTGGKKKNPAKSFLVSSFVVEKSFGKKSLFKMTGKNDGILNKKIQAYDVIIWDDYFFLWTIIFDS